jgi:excisionase family DNA binding protein
MDRPEQSLLTSGEAAEMLGVERRTLLRMEDRGALEAVRAYPSAQRRYRRTDIEGIIGSAS